MSKLKNELLKILDNEPRVHYRWRDDILEIFIQGLEIDESWGCYDLEDNEIRINGQTSLNFNYKKVWVGSDYSFEHCITIKTIKTFQKYLKIALNLAAILEHTSKQIKNLQRLDEMESDFQ